MYKVLACLFDPLGYLVPFTTRAKVLVQDLWKGNIGWDNVIHPPELLEKWHSWVQELPTIKHIKIPSLYVPVSIDVLHTTFSLPIFCDASQRPYGSLAFLRMEDNTKQVSISFVHARSRVAPKKEAFLCPAWSLVLPLPVLSWPAPCKQSSPYHFKTSPCGVSRRGKPFEILCDNGTNFTGGNHELQDAFKSMENRASPTENGASL